MSIEEVKKFVESWIIGAKKDSVAVIDKPIQICGVTLPAEVVGLLKAHYFVECEERANQILQMLEDVPAVPTCDERITELEAELKQNRENREEWLRHACAQLNIPKGLGIVDVGRSNMRRIEFLEAENAALRAANRSWISRLISWARSLVKQ